MTYTAEPVLVPTPTGWMVLQRDQHRRPEPMTPGIQADEPLPQSWLAPLQAPVLIRCESPPYGLAVWPSPVLAAVNWIQERVSGIAPPRMVEAC